ncbi:protein FAM187B-like [Suncus etruscus]|uniref:protein FAM187B-like n=1 Tax=Suncus etruscus TaxID=109475 RepID=UPI00210F9B79|nr:protein FAM187B-like [Suncus etruscus]
MLTILWLLLNLALAAKGYYGISCAEGQQCQKALLSDNDVVLSCNFSEPQWSYLSLQNGSRWSSNFTNVSNLQVLSGSQLLIKNPSTSQTGFYRCQDRQSNSTLKYEIDFQDVSTINIIHRSLNQRPLQNQTLQPGNKILIFTQWEPWQDCSHCGKPGERKRLGFCYIQEFPADPVPCWLYLGKTKVQSSRIRPELQIERCNVTCKGAGIVNAIYDNYKIDEMTDSAWISCPLGSIYRPLIWEVNNRPLTWQDQLSGKDISSIMDMGSGGQRLQVFQPAVYRCFVQQELMAQYNPQPETEQQRVAKPQAGQEQEEAEPQKMKASSVLRGLQLMLLGGTVLGLLGVIFTLSRPSRNKKADRVLLVK